MAVVNLDLTNVAGDRFAPEVKNLITEGKRRLKENTQAPVIEQVITEEDGSIRLIVRIDP